MRTQRMRLVRLMRALNRIDEQYDRVCSRIDLKESLFVLLYACVEDEPRSQKDICDEWCIPRTTLNTTVKEQEAAGHVELVPCGNKQKLVKLTQSGRAYAEEMLGDLLDAEERTGGHIDDKLIEGIESFGDLLENEFNRLNGSVS